MDLLKLVVSVDGLSDPDASNLGQNYYFNDCVKTHPKGIISAHDGQEIHFWADRFIHAFYTTSDQKRPYLKDKVARERIERVLWVKPTVTGQALQSTCWEGIEDTVRGEKLKRLYIVHPLLYVVWLEGRDNGGWKFSTAYTALGKQIKNYTRDMRCIWKK